MRQAILVGHNFNSILGMARALGTEGYIVNVIRTGVSAKSGLFNRVGRFPEARCKFINNYINGKYTPDEIIDILISQFGNDSEKGILFPVDDVCAEIIDLNLDKLKPFFFMPNVYDEQGGVVKLMDKFYMKNLAKSVGLLAPNGWSIHIENGHYHIPDEITYPCFAKAEMPFTNRKAFMGKCVNRTDLDSLLKRVAAFRSDSLMIVEEYVQIEREYGAVGYVNCNGACIPAITEKTVLGHGSNAGVTACGQIHDPNEFPDVLKKLKELMIKTGLNGLFDIDLYMSNGEIYFNELNVRMGAEGIGTLIAGVNLVSMCAKGLMDIDSNIDFDISANPISFANEKPLISDYGEGFIKWKDYVKCIQEADYCYIKSYDDRAPSFDFTLHILRQFVKRILKKNKTSNE